MLWPNNTRTDVTTHSAYLDVISNCLCHLVRLKMAAGNAQIGMPAPDFTAKAVMPDGKFQDLTLSTYRGTPQPVSGGKCLMRFASKSWSWIETTFVYTTKGWNNWACDYYSCVTKQTISFMSPLLQGSMSSFSSIPWTSPSCVQLRSLLSATLPKSSGKSAVRSSRRLLTRTSHISRGNYMTVLFQLR